MCNLHHVSPKGDAERYFARIAKRVYLPDYSMTTVGPFDAGVFIRPHGDELLGVVGQWGMIRPGQRERVEFKEYPAKKPGAKPRREPMLKNNARIETAHKSPAFKDAWAAGRRCLIPAAWLQEPNWETGKCIWWRLQRADGEPWIIAGLWSEWTDPATGELVPNFAMLTFNVDEHTLLNRLHKPERDRATGEILPADQQDKRGEAHIEPEHWDAWLHGDEATARALLVPPPVEMFDPRVTMETDQRLAQLAAPPASNQDRLL